MAIQLVSFIFFALKSIMKIENLLLSVIFCFCLINLTNATLPAGDNLKDPFGPEIVLAQDTLPPVSERYGDHISNPANNPFDLQDPSIIEKEVNFDPETGTYIITEKIGDEYFRMPSYMTFEEYLEYKSKQEEKAYFDRLAGVGKRGGKLSNREDPLSKIDVEESLRDRLFGGTGVDIKPQGNIDLTFAVDYQRTQAPGVFANRERVGGFDFDMDIEMSVEAAIGEKLKMSTNYNTQATFDFQNTMKLDYDADAFNEDDIIKTIEVGNVSFPLRSSLIKGSQSLFGLHTELRFGKLTLGLVASQQKSQNQSIRIEGGSQVQEFEVRADEYDENRHFFLTHYNRGTFEESLQNLPQIRSLFKITRMEVWITNDRNETENIRDIVAISDIGETERLTNTTPDYETIPPFTSETEIDIEGRRLPGINLANDNGANEILTDLVGSLNDTLAAARDVDNAVASLTNLGFQQSRDFEKVNARLLSPSEYTYNADLGFISLNVNLRPDQVLGVSFEYDYNGETFQVGELTKEGTGGDDPGSLPVIYVKMLKSTTQRTDVSTWDLMMKNHYNIGAFQVNPDDFVFDIFYDDPGKAPKRFIPARSEEPLLRIFNLDQLNVQGDPCPDGIFDFVPNITINPRNGRIMFPVLEPFGNSLAESLANLPDPLVDTTLIYDELYRRTLFNAREFTEKNRFIMKGNYKSSVSSEISLGAFNLPEGSVTVRAGGRVLTEGQDYDIDYNIGRIKILNDGVLNSGTPVDVSFEDNTLFSVQTRTMLGVRADYEISKDFNVGATYMRLFERPFTQKVNIGDDPINNRVVGLDVNYRKEAPFLTKMVDAIPFIETKEESSINLVAEVAALKPSHPKAINVGTTDEDQKGGTVYVDDFEGTTSNNDLRTPANNWVLASVPQGATNALGSEVLEESKLINDRNGGANRALINWYRIDQTLRSNNNNSYTELINQDEVFPGRQIQNQLFGALGTFDISYYPSERGPYNFDLLGGVPLGDGRMSAGLDNTGGLLEPETRWGGIMRALTNNDFQASNIEYLEFWVLNPFINNPENGTNIDGGELNIDLGNISEDILRDSRKAFENGIPTEPNVPTDDTNWSRIPRTNAIINTFSSDREELAIQDIGLDGYSSAEESTIYQDYLDDINSSGLNQDTKASIQADIANDDFVSFRDDRFTDQNTIFDRYRAFNNPEGNSGPPVNGRVNSSTNIPDSEDLNNDNTLGETESYFNYKIPIKPGGVGPSGEIEVDLESSPFISDVRYIDGTDRVWYRYRIPLNTTGPERTAVNGIQDFRSIRFIRMYLREFRQPVTLRFATLELVRNQWRRYTLRGLDTNPCLAVDANCVDQDVEFDINAVNVEENSGKIPFAYDLPPGIIRERSLNTTFPNQFQNEQSITLEVQNLDGGMNGEPGFGVGAYKIINMDWRLYENINMFVHAEAFDDNDLLGIPDGDVALFIRMGSDFEQNYYEYEIPLDMSTDPMAAAMDAYELWRTSNAIDIKLDEFKNAKIRRNAAGFSPTDRYIEPYEYRYRFDPTDDMLPEESKMNNIIVKGNPNFGQVKGVMLGIRNNGSEEHSIEVWCNELRLNGIDEQGGVAALARADIKLADLADVTVSANANTEGWGQLEDDVNARTRESTFAYDVSANVALDKFLPEESGVKIPLFVGYSKSTETPKYDPYDQDLTLKESMDAATSEAERKEIKERALDVTEIKSWNITNLRKERTGGKDDKPKPWDIENFDLTYAYTNTNRHNPIIERDVEEVREGRINYRFNRKSKYIQPFKKLSKSKYLKLITDFNFSLLPNSVAVSTDMIREFQQTRYRFVDDGAGEFNKEFFNKQFRWNRSYDLNWDFTKNLKLNFNARNEAVIDELKEINPDGSKPTSTEKKDFIKDGIKDFGRNKNYSHQFGLDYKLPLKSIPFLDWITVKAQYNADYSWTAAALNTESLGNVIQNGQTQKLDGDINFEQLYKKSKFLSAIDKKKSRRKRRGNNKKDEKDPKKKGEKDEKEVKEKKKKKKGEVSNGTRLALRPLLFLRKARISYSKDRSTVIPGFTQNPEILGRSGSDPNNDWWKFVAGVQPDIIPDNDGNTDFLERAANNGWISDDIFLNQQVIQNETNQIDLKITLEPFTDFSIDLTANRKRTDNQSLYFKWFDEPDFQGYEHRLPREFGSYEISFFSLNTLFDDDEALWNQFLDNRAVISEAIGSDNEHQVDGSEYKEGFGRVQQNVLLPAFISAYTGTDAASEVDPEQKDNYARGVLFNKLPKINWQLNYRGLSKVSFFEKYFASFNLTHGYQSTLQVNSFVTNQRFKVDDFVPNPVTGNFITRFEIPELLIDERFAPLIGLDVRLHNEMTFKVDFKKSRKLALSSQDNSLTETLSDEYVIGWGHRIKDVYIAFLKGGKKKKKKSRSSKKKSSKNNPSPNAAGGKNKDDEASDLNFAVDFGFRNTRTYRGDFNTSIERRVPTRGNTTITFNPAVDYDISKKLNARLFFDYNHSVPLVGGATTTSMAGGVRIRFTLD